MLLMASEAPRTQFHRPAMVSAVLEWLAPRPGAVMVDGTCGTGGHSVAILPSLLPDGRLIAMDRDLQALAVAKPRLIEFEPRVEVRHADFRRLPEVLSDVGLHRVDGVLLDLGMSSLQVDDPERGFSFLREGPLDMRMDSAQPMTAQRLVNEASAQDLALLLRTFGEERYAAQIARRIVSHRREQPLQTTIQLAQLIAGAVPAPARHGRLHPATRTFQALRMAVNDELGALRDALDALPRVLSPSGRAVILSFHSLEDRMVKQSFAAGERQGIWRRLTKKPLRPSAAEIAENPRIRSVKLRAVERTA